MTTGIKDRVFVLVAFQIYDIDQDGYISNGELFQVLKMMVGNNLKEVQLQQIIDKTILQFDKDGDGKISFQEFCDVSFSFSVFISFSSCRLESQFTCKCFIRLLKVLSFNFLVSRKKHSGLKVPKSTLSQL